MRSLKTTLVVAGLALGLMCAVPSQSRELSIYAGEEAASRGVTLSPWGGGAAVETTLNGLVSNRSIQLNVPSLYSGGMMVFANPIEIADPSVLSQYDYLLFDLKFKSLTPLGLTDPGSKPTGTGEYKQLPADYYGNFYYEDLPMVPKIRRMRVVLWSADGRAVSHTGIVVPRATDEEGWFSVAMPLAAFGIKSPGQGFKLARIAVGADFADTVWLGQLRVVTDDTPIYVESIDDQDVGAGDIVVLKGDAEAGHTPITYTWDFNSTDGIQDDGFGPLVQMTYSKAGTYTVTLTAKDPDGIKKPASTKVKIAVNE